MDRPSISLDHDGKIILDDEALIAIEAGVSLFAGAEERPLTTNTTCDGWNGHCRNTINCSGSSNNDCKNENRCGADATIE
jgi:hypothetical protein